MRVFKLTNYILSVFLITAPLLANADVIYPALDVQNHGSQGDTGSSFVPGSSFDADSTAFAIVFDDGTPSISLPLTDFSLTSTYNGGTSLYTGSFSAGTLLSGSFTDLNVQYTGNVFGTDFYTFDATVSYTGGSLATGIAAGSMTGSFDSNSNFTAKIGEITVVPVPAAFWLFGSGLLGLVAVARRQTV
jgi:hypothetical protein